MSGLRYLLDTNFLLCMGEQQLAAVGCRGQGQFNSHPRHRTRTRTGGGDGAANRPPDRRARCGE